VEHKSRSLGDLISFVKSGNGLVGKTQETSFKVTVFTDGIIKINVSPHEDFDFHSYASIAEPSTSLKIRINESEESIEILSDKIILEINKSPVRFNFFNNKRLELNCEEPGLGTAINNGQITSYKKLQTNERFIGLGEKVGNLDRSGTGLTNWNTDHFGYGPETDPIYSSIPFYIGLHNELVYGIFLDNSSKSHFNFGASNNRFSSFSVEQGNLDYYFIYGDSVQEIIEGYTHITGRMDMPPLWSLGYQQCRYSYFPDKEVYTLANTFRDKNIPCDVIVLDIHYMDKYKIFTWDKDRFPDPKAMIERLKQQGFEVVVICDPGIKIEDGYGPYEDGLKNDVFFKYPDGTNYEAEVWPGLCCFPDFTNPASRNWWGNQLKAYSDLGIEGYWNDMNEIASWGNFMPSVMTFHYEGHETSTLLARNVYGLEMARSTYEGAKELLNGRRPFNLTRSAFAGIQRYSAKWTGDNSASDEHMILGIMLQNSLGLSGVSFTGDDIGGFHKDSRPELYARWIAFGAFSPLFRGHSMVNTRDSEPWSYGEGIEEIARNYISLRYKLLPYLYSLFYQSSRTGLPVVRSLAIEHSFEDIIYQEEYQAQYYFGPNILVAPITSLQTIAKIYLPEGSWYDLFTGLKYEGASEIYMDTPLDKIPLLVKASSVIPSQGAVQSTKENPGSELVLHVYKGSDHSTFEYYEDDGSTFAYEHGDFYLRTIEFDGKQGSITLIEPQGKFKSRFQSVKMVLHGFSADLQFKINGEPLNVEEGNWRFVEPIRDFDPQGITRDLQPEDVIFAYFPLAKNRIEIAWT
jgi:alpha-glucosidase